MKIGKPPRFFLWLSASDVECLESCSAVEIHHQTAVGMAVLLSSLFAFASAFYAVKVVGGGVVLALVFGLLWTLMVMNLNQLLVSSSSPSPSVSLDVAIFRRYIAPLMLRAPLAVVIGITIAIPLELSLFEIEIQGQVAEVAQVSLESERDQQRAELQKERKPREDELKSGLSVLETTALDLRKRKQETQDKMLAVAAKPIIVVTMVRRADGTLERKQFEKLRPEYAVLTATLDDVDRQLTAVEQRIAQERKDLYEFEQWLKLQNAEIQHAHDIQASAASRKRFGLSTRYSVLKELRGANRAYNELFWLVRLIFVLIELLPVLAKVFSNVKEYEMCLEARARRVQECMA